MQDAAVLNGGHLNTDGAENDVESGDDVIMEQQNQQ